MSGPVAMMLGDFGFESLGFGYQGLTRRIQTPWVDVQVAQTLNQQQWTGPTSEEVTISGALFPVQFGGQESLDGIIAAANAGTPMMLVSGSAQAGKIHGMFTVQGVDEDRSFHDRFGQAHKNTYSIALKRYQQTQTAASGQPSLANLFG